MLAVMLRLLVLRQLLLLLLLLSCFSPSMGPSRPPSSGCNLIIVVAFHALKVAANNLPTRALYPPYDDILTCWSQADCVFLESMHHSLRLTSSCAKLHREAL